MSRPERRFTEWCIAKHLCSSIRNIHEEYSKTQMTFDEEQIILYDVLRRLVEMMGGNYTKHENAWEAVKDLIEAEKHCCKVRKVIKDEGRKKELDLIVQNIRKARVSMVTRLLSENYKVTGVEGKD